MKKESRDQILGAYDHAFSLLGFNTFPEGLRYVCDEMEKYLQILKQARSREGLEALLAKEREPSVQQLGAAVDTIRLLPYYLRKVLPDAAKEAAKQLPHLRGGRPYKVKPQEIPQICDEIGKLYARGVTLKDAQQRMAQRKAVSLRTIQRVWQKRKKIAAKAFPAESN